MSMHHHLLVPDLFLPPEMAVSGCAGLALPALEKLLARAQPETLSTITLEAWLCDAFGVQGQAIAPVTLQADGMQPGVDYWLRADPVHVQMQREQMVLLPEVTLDADEAAQLCASLNVHFAAEGLFFCAPHPQRWYLKLDAAPEMMTHALAQVTGRNMLTHLPHGADALRWHSVFNEVQMLFYEHAVNLARTARGVLPINSIWLWGGGRATQQLMRPFTKVVSDSLLADAFAHVAGISGELLSDDAVGCNDAGGGGVLIVWEGLRHALQRGDLHAWRDSLLRLEQVCAVPLWEALRAGRVAPLTVDVPGVGRGRRFLLTRSAVWKVWRRPRSLAEYALV